MKVSFLMVLSFAVFSLAPRTHAQSTSSSQSPPASSQSSGVKDKSKLDKKSVNAPSSSSKKDAAVGAKNGSHSGIAPLPSP